MTHGIFVVQTMPARGREADYDTWYTQVHVPEILHVPGFASAQRFVNDPSGRPGDAPPEFRNLAIYELDAPAAEAGAALAAALPGLTWSDALGPRRTLVAYTPVTPRITR
jgi:hypothetical protein